MKRSKGRIIFGFPRLLGAPIRCILKLIRFAPTQNDDAATHKVLHEFKNRHYTAQSMTLVVQSQEEMDTLKVGNHSSCPPFKEGLLSLVLGDVGGL